MIEIEINHDAIAQQNDEFWMSFGAPNGIPGRVVMTQGVSDLGMASRLRMHQAIVAYDGFTEDNDPDAHHDFGEITIDVDGAPVRIWFKLDLYDLRYETGSEQPDDPQLTRRVMTLLMPSEY